MSETKHLTLPARGLAIVAAGFMMAMPLFVGCAGDSGDTFIMGGGDPQPPADPPPTDTTLDMTDDLPGLNVTIVELGGASGLGGQFQVGDTVTVTFTLKKDDGTLYPLSEMDSAAIWISGPTSNYQHLLPGSGYSYSDVRTASVKNVDSSYTYTFSDPIPATYPAPLNDTTRFTEGELTGQALLSGTYTVAFRIYKYFTTESGDEVRDVGNATSNFLFGTATTIAPREVVKLENCNQCHVNLQVHGGSYRDPALCVTCHTAGAEDGRSVDDSSDVTPFTIEFKVMIHKIHNGAHLPSVNGVATNMDGTRNYAATPIGYQLGSRSIHDFSDVHFPTWPNMSDGMPVDTGYDALAGAEQDQEDEILGGVTACYKCHGDAGSGAPAQGGIAYSQPSRRACGSCHDDIDWTRPYTSNGQTMPAQANDSTCVNCHTNNGSTLDPAATHVHPLEDLALNPGLNVVITAVTPSAGATLDPGEKLQVTMTIQDDMGADVDPATDMDALYVVMNGPTHNRQVVLYTTIPVAALGAQAPSYTINVPQPTVLDYLGDASGGAETLAASFAPFWTAAQGASTTVYERTAPAVPGSDTLTADAVSGQNYVEVTSGGTFAAGDYIVLDDGGPNEEYLRVMGVVVNRVFVGTMYSQPSQPFLRLSHTTGTTVDRVDLTAKALTTDYTLDEANGQVNLVAGQFTGGNAVLVSYTTDFVMPAIYPPPYNDSPDLDDSTGKWVNKPIEDGTYTVGIWARQTINVLPLRTLGTGTDDTRYRAPSLLATGGDFLVGSASDIEPYDLISSADNCTSCHGHARFHGGSRRGADTCLMCHASPGAEDAPKYRYGVAADTTGVTISFRTMLHSIHMGEDLANASTYTVVGHNGSSHRYEEVVFPAMPNRVKHCTKCHGDSNSAWMEPADRSHSTDQTNVMVRWQPVCGACHDSSDATGHMLLNTYIGGYESCGACHDPGSVYSVEIVHKNR